VDGIAARLLVERLETGPDRAVVVEVRSPLLCDARQGVCQQCYGWDPSTRKLVELGTAVGILAAMAAARPERRPRGPSDAVDDARTAVAEPTPGLVAYWTEVERMLSGQPVNGAAVLAECSGRVSVFPSAAGAGLTVVVRSTATSREAWHDGLPSGQLSVEPGQRVTRGQSLTAGPVDPGQLLRICGIEAFCDYVLAVAYRLQGEAELSLDDRHLELLVAHRCGDRVIDVANDGRFVAGERVGRAAYRDELSRLETGAVVVDPGDSAFGCDQLADRLELELANDALVSSGQRPAAVRDPEPPQCRSVFSDGVVGRGLFAAVRGRRATRELAREALLGRRDVAEDLEQNAVLGYRSPIGAAHPTLAGSRVAKAAALPDVAPPSCRVGPVAATELATH
jgi:DNA-directed RNA polymerase subunit beta'